VVHEKLHTPPPGKAGAQALAGDALTVMHEAPVPKLSQPLAQVVVHVPQKHWSPAPQSDSCTQGASQFVCESVPLSTLPPQATAVTTPRVTATRLNESGAWPVRERRIERE